MMIWRSRSVTQNVFWLGAIGVWVILLSASTVAQRPGPPSTGPSLKEETRKTEVRETMLRNPDTGLAAEKVDPKRLEAAIEKVKEDFKRIQVVRNEIVRELLADKPLEPKSISQRLEEVNKRAERLKAYLMPPEAEPSEKGSKKPSEWKDEEIKPALVQLCNRIVSFIENPILKNPGVSDVQQSAKAGADLLFIIELSGALKKSADRLSKSAH